MASNYAGVDWASEKHDVAVQNAAGEQLLAASFAHDEAGLRSLCRQLVRLNVQLVAIERPDGVLVERLLDAGLRVLALHPNQVAASRARFRVSGGKSDGFDAFVLCELARTDHHRFRVLEPDSDSRADRFQLRVGAGAQADVLGVRDGFAEQRADVVVVQRVDDVAPGASADHESEVAEYAQLLGHGGLFHLDRTG